jgi:2-furoyl-CoA dehydrogenase FAD binding subunit
VKPARFDYVRADTLGQAHAVLAEEGSDASVIAGGQTLVPMLSMRMARPKVLLDIMHLHALSTVTIEGEMIRVGAAVRQAELLDWPELADRQPLLALALPWVGHAQTRARGTVCGSAALADPSAEIPLALIALAGDITLSAHAGRRQVPAVDFFQGLMSTARRDDELIEAVRFPARRPGHGYAFREFARRHGDFAIVACAAVASDNGARLAVGGVADRPTARDFGTLNGDALLDALNAFAGDLDAQDDLHGTAHYRRMLVRELGHQTIAEARACRA